MPKMMQQIIAQDAASKRMTPQQRKKAESKVNQASARMIQRLRDELPQKINYAELIEQLSYSLYDKYFTEEELQDLIAFYQSPTGKLVMPNIMKLVNDIVQEEMKNLK
jgi:hypothetical protein